MILAAATHLLVAREQMAFTLGFHIILASLGVAFPAITMGTPVQKCVHGFSRRHP